MKKGKILIIICILTVALLCVVPIPHKLKDGGTVYLEPIIPIYGIHIYNAIYSSIVPHEDDEIVYKKGYGISLFGMEIFENTYFVTESQNDV